MESNRDVYKDYTKAVYTCDLDKVKNILDKEHYGYIPWDRLDIEDSLDLCIDRGCFNIAKYFIGLGYTFDIPNYSMDDAIKYGHICFINLLRRYINTINISELSLIESAEVFKYIAALQPFNNRWYNTRISIRAITNHHYSLVQTMLHFGIFDNDVFGTACMYGDYRISKLLYNNGYGYELNVNLERACNYKHRNYTLIKYLLILDPSIVYVVRHYNILYRPEVKQLHFNMSNTSDLLYNRFPFVDYDTYYTTINNTIKYIRLIKTLIGIYCYNIIISFTLEYV